MKKKDLALVLFVFAAAIIISGCSSKTAGPAGPGGPAGYVMQFQNGVYPSTAYGGAAGTEIDSYYPGINFSATSTVSIGYYSVYSEKERYLIKYDLTSLIPGNVNVTKAYLSINSSSGAGTNTFSVYPLTAAFNASTATWADKDTSVPWTAAGGDFSAVPESNAVTMYAIQQYVFELDAAMVKNWISDPSTNYGMVLVASNETTGTDEIGIYSTAAAAPAASRPMLTVYYTLP